MVAVRYKFLGIVESDSGVSADFSKGSSGVLGLVFRSKIVVNETEKGCKELYEEACANRDNKLGSYASFDSKEDARKAFYAIRKRKRERGIPCDVDDDLA